LIAEIKEASKPFLTNSWPSSFLRVDSLINPPGRLCFLANAGILATAWSAVKKTV
jgi:hypothetical protein